jgi:hypothetical protein
MPPVPLFGSLHTAPVSSVLAGTDDVLLSVELFVPSLEVESLEGFVDEVELEVELDEELDESAEVALESLLVVVASGADAAPASALAPVAPSCAPVPEPFTKSTIGAHATIPTAPPKPSPNPAPTAGAGALASAPTKPPAAVARPTH